MSAFDEAFENTAKLEGGAPYGITEDVAKKNGYTGALSELPLETAKDIHRSAYWRPLHLDNIAALSQPVALKLFDIAVNAGGRTAARFLQRSLNALNRQQADYPDATVDGVIGSKTVAAFGTFIGKRKQQGETVLLKALASLQGARYIELAEAREANEPFVFDWLANRV
ncbi:putative peptidoglycan-binding domain-containing protein [Streptomyces anulatus]|uniref:putative peptidoglycan-binding domain-containing protein n=1 Tax=Streptomyces TaxID=1883 RepID=UPI000BFDF05B|nr:putative peptidoglycan-binding domain-containing protein [Streptomyces sp. or3]